MYRLQYTAKDQRFNQQLKLSAHLVDKERSVSYCWNHKVASSFWMWIFQWIKAGKEPDPSTGTDHNASEYIL